MVLIDKLTKRKVYRYLLSEGVIVIKKDYSLTPHKDTEVPNLYVWMLLRSLKSRDYVECVYNWQFNYFFLNAEGKKYLNEFLGITEEVQPHTWKNDETRQYEIRDENNKRAYRGPRGDRSDRPEGGRVGGRGRRRDEPAAETQPGTQEAPQTAV
jgi:small subunit ribosomal protein S10e